MKKFQFPLERVLDWRRVQFKLESAAAAKIRAEHERLQGQRRQLRAQQDGARAASGAVAFAAAEMYTLAAYLQRCQVLETAMKQQAGAFEAGLALQQKRVLEADRAVQLLEKLRGQRLGEWERDAAAAQEQFAAEAFLCRWNAGGE